MNKQRKGQWLYNKIVRDSLGSKKNDPIFEQVNTARILWNMSNEEFDNLMKDYNDQ